MEIQTNGLKMTIKKIRIDTLESPLHIFNISGDIESNNSAIFGKFVLDSMGETEPPYCAINFGGLTYSYSSAGVGELCRILKRVMSKNGYLVLVDLPPLFHEVFHLMGLNRFFDKEDKIEEAISFFKNYRSQLEKIVFPKHFRCSHCDSEITASKAGEVRCMKCLYIGYVHESGRIWGFDWDKLTQ